VIGCQCNLHDNNDATKLPQDAHAEQYSCLNVTTYLKQLQHSKTDFEKKQPGLKNMKTTQLSTT